MRVIRIKQVKFSDLLYFTALFLFITQEYIETSRYVDYFGYTVVATLKWGSVLLFLLSIVKEKRYSKKIICIAIGLLFLFAVLFVTTSRYTLLIVLIILLASQKIDVKKLVNYVYKISLFSLLFVIGSSIIGIIPNTIVAQSEGERIRQTLGFDYVSFAFNYFTNILLCRIYIKTPEGLAKKNTMKWTEVLVWVGAIFILYYLTKTNLTFLVSLFAILLYISFVKFRWFRKIHDGNLAVGFWMWIFPVCFALTLYACVKYNSFSPIWVSINQLANKRLMLSNEAVFRYGIHLFGNEMDMNNTALGSTNIYIDSGYMQLILLYGVVLTMIFLFIYMMMMRQAVKRKETGLFIWLICVAFFNVVNNMTFDLLLNSSLYAVWVLAKKPVGTIGIINDVERQDINKKQVKLLEV